MRRKDREVENQNEIYDILKRCDTIKIAMHGDVYPYLVPVSFGAEIVQNKIVIYFHCAQQGAKLDLLRANPHVCVEGEIFLQVEKTAHGITARYESVIGFGNAEICGNESAAHGVELLMDHCGYPGFDGKQCVALGITRVYRITLSSVTGKRRFAP